MHNASTTFHHLRVVHRSRDAAGHGLHAELAAQLGTQGFFLDTCLRELCVIADPNETLPAIEDGEHYVGADAYRFLLLTITGLNSAVPGETNIAGQFRCAWKRWLDQAPQAQLWRLRPVMQQLFADNKRVRQTYLQAIGGHSYGSLLRKRLQPEASERLLFVGTGRFALSMLPFFRQQPVGLWNHRLHPGLRVPADVRVFEPDAAETAAQWADTLVLTTPPHTDHDTRWAQLATEHGVQRIAHLGLRRAEPGVWHPAHEAQGIVTLDDIFDLRHRQSAVRRLQVARARSACERIANERNMQVQNGAYLPDDALPAET